MLGWSFFLASIAWEIAVSMADALLFWLLAEAPFVGLGWYLAIGRFRSRAIRRRRTLYGLTNDRILILVNGGLESHSVQALPGPLLVMRKPGTTGSIVFGEPYHYSDRVLPIQTSLLPAAGVQPALHDISKPARVHALIVELRTSCMVRGPVRSANDCS